MLIWDEKVRPSFSIIKNYLDKNLDKKFYDKFCNLERNNIKESNINWFNLFLLKLFINKNRILLFFFDWCDTYANIYKCMEFYED